jgi:hypothetical protein
VPWNRLQEMLNGATMVVMSKTISYFVWAAAILLANEVLAADKGAGQTSSSAARAASKRAAWINTPRAGWGPFGSKASPRDQGFRAAGPDNTIITAREPSCDRSFVISNNEDDPYLIEAMSLGFKMYGCIKANLNNDDTIAALFPLTDIVKRR